MKDESVSLVFKYGCPFSLNSGRCGILQCPNGLQVAYISGMDSSKSSKVKKLFEFT